MLDVRDKLAIENEKKGYIRLMYNLTATGVACANIAFIKRRHDAPTYWRSLITVIGVSGVREFSISFQ